MLPSKASLEASASQSRLPLRVLVISHGHPANTRGGAEIAAYALYHALNQSSGYEAWFLGCHPNLGSRRLGIAISQPFDDREFIYASTDFDWFKFANRDARFPTEFRQLLLKVKPDIIHFHHFAFVGLEALQIAKDALPQARVVLTAHEYLLICNANGQMVTNETHHLCHRATLESCHACFPEHRPTEFFLRKHWAELFLSAVDAFIAPSQFLATRLNAWGIDAARLHVVENLVASESRAASEAREYNPELLANRPLRVGFFGQISRLKGIIVLLAAAAMLEKDSVPAVSFDIYGEYRGQSPEFQAEYLELLKRAGPNVRYHGAYGDDQVDIFMQEVALVIVPSVWWENSPVVIQEARRNRRPVICSDIGGMAEKVVNGLDGWHFPVGNARSLAALLRDLSADRQAIGEMSRTMRPLASPGQILMEHTAIYNSVTGLPS